MPDSMPVVPRPAAAVVLMRERAGGVMLLMVRRHTRIDFMPDVFVFPGGSAAPSDREIERSPGLCGLAGGGPTALGTGFRAAAVRECFEEAGVLLARRDRESLVIGPADEARFAAYRDELDAGTISLHDIAIQEHLTLATDSLIHWAHWITPEIYPKRYDTHFFLAEMPSGQAAVHDHRETTDCLWVTPEDALNGASGGSLPIVDPTTHQLRALLGLSGVAAARERFTGATPRTIMPRVVIRDGEEVSEFADDA